MITKVDQMFLLIGFAAVVFFLAFSQRKSSGKNEMDTYSEIETELCGRD